MILSYQFGEDLYLNITNRCCCACIFCIRDGHDGVGDGDNLWLEREPSAEEVIADLKKRDLSSYREIVFCGYGEPTERLDVLLEICRYLRSAAPKTPIRLNTNGLADLIHGKETAPSLAGMVDVVSISLNAPNAARYVEVANPVYGEDAFPHLLHYAEQCKKYVPEVKFTLVDVLRPGEVEECQQLADRMGIPLRVREKI